MTKLDEEVIKTIVDALRTGSYLETAAAAAGVKREHLREWLRAGANEDGTELELRLHAAVTKALAEWERDAAAVLAASQDWRAHAHLLERRVPDRWGKVDRLDVADRTGTPARRVDLEGFDPELLEDDELETLRRLLAKGAGLVELVEAEDAEVIELEPRRSIGP